MRVGQLTDCYLPVLNGVTNLVRTHKAQLERLGHKAPIFTTGHLNYADQEPDIIRSRGIPLGDTGYCAALGYSRRARSHLATMDLLHVHHPFIAGWLALRYGRRFGQPVVYTNHTRLDVCAEVYVPRALRWLARRLVQWYLPWFIARCDLVIAPSAGLAAVMRERWRVKSPVVVVPNGIDLARFQNPPALISRAQLGLPSEGPLAIYTGRLAMEKNLSFLLQAFSLAAPAVGKAYLLLLGGGPQAAALRALVGELDLGGRVILPGVVPYEQVPSYLAAADLFVITSVSEVHPLSLMEGLAAGLPALGVDAPGVADTIEDDVNGLLTDHDLMAFSDALGCLLADAGLRARLAEGARQTSVHYSIERTTGQIVTYYRRLLTD